MKNRARLALFGLALLIAGIFLPAQPVRADFTWSRQLLDASVTSNLQPVDLPGDRKGVIYTVSDSGGGDSDKRLRARLAVYDSSAQPNWHFYPLGSYRAKADEFNHHLVSTASGLSYFPDTEDSGEFFTADSLRDLPSYESPDKLVSSTSGAEGEPPGEWAVHTFRMEVPSPVIHDAAAGSRGLVLLVQTGDSNHNLRVFTHSSGSAWTEWKSHIVASGCRYCSVGFGAELLALNNGFAAVYLDTPPDQKIRLAETDRPLPASRSDWQLRTAERGPYSDGNNLPVRLGLFESGGQAAIAYFGRPIGYVNHPDTTLFMVTPDRPRQFAPGNKTRRVVVPGAEPGLRGYGLSGAQIGGLPVIAYNTGKELRIAFANQSLPGSADDWENELLVRSGWGAGSPIVFAANKGEPGVVFYSATRDSLGFIRGRD